MDHRFSSRRGESPRPRALIRTGIRPWSYHPAADHGLTFSERNLSLECERGLFRRLLQSGIWAALRRHLRRAHDFEIAGGHHLPVNGPCVIVANHSSHLDALSLAASVPPARATEVSLLAAGDTFFRSRIRAGLASLLLNARPVWRGKCGAGALQTLRSRLEGDHGPILVLFPEGTRSRTGRMGRFKAGIGALVAGTAVPVVPAWIEGAYEAWPAGQSRPGQGQVRVTFGSALTFEKTPNQRRGWCAVARKLEERVRALGEVTSGRRHPRRTSPPPELIPVAERRVVHAASG